MRNISKHERVIHHLLKGSLTLLLLPLFQACDKDHMFDFLKSTGKDVTVFRNVDQKFRSVILNDNVDLVLVQGDTWSVKLEGGENLLPGIETDFSDSTLTIRNLNKFDWVRSYDRKITATVTAPDFMEIGYEGTGTISNIDTLRQDSIYVRAYAGSGFINLCIDVKISHFALNTGSADFNISGYSGSNFIFAGNYGPFHCLNLQTNNTFMINQGSNDCYVNAKQWLDYTISGLGNIYYSGHPNSVTGYSTGEGKAIPLD